MNALKKRVVFLAAMALPAGLAWPAFAQSGATVAPPNRADQAVTPNANPPAAPPAAPAQAQPAAPIAPFVVREIRVEGSTLPAARIHQVIDGFTGKTVDGPAVNHIADALAEAYENGPIVLYTVVVPQQDFAGGVLRLKAVEGHIAEVAVQGDIAGRDLSLVRAYIAKLTAETPLTRRTWERYLTLIRDIPELNPDVNLVAGAELGEVRLELTLHPRRAAVGVAVNNRGTALLGRTQGQVDGYAYGLMQQGDVLQASFAAPTDFDRFQYYALSYTTPVGSEGTTVAANFGYLRTRPQILDLQGHAYSAGLQVSHPLLRNFTEGAYVSLGIDGVNSDNALFAQRLSDDRSRAVRAAASYGSDKTNSYFGASLAVSMGLGGTLGGRTQNPAATDLSFKKVNGRVALNQRLAQPLVLRLSAAGQYTGDLLPSSEQFALGGAQFGRGYEAAVIAGDNAAAGSAELAFQPQGLPQWATGSELYGFADKGWVWYKGRLGLATTRLDVSSIGGGARLMIKGRHMLELEAAHTLPNGNPYLNRDDTRVLFSIRTFL